MKKCHIKVALHVTCWIELKCVFLHNLYHEVRYHSYAEFLEYSSCDNQAFDLLFYFQTVKNSEKSFFHMLLKKIVAIDIVEVQNNFLSRCFLI